MPRNLISSVASALLLGIAVPTAAVAQAGAAPAAPAADTTTGPAQAPAKPPAPPAGPALSGVIYANYQKGGVLGERSANRFDVERAYLTVRAPAGPRVIATKSGSPP